MALKRTRILWAVLLLCLGAVLDARVSHASTISIQESTHAASRQPYAELNPTCPAISKMAAAFANGAIWGIFLAGIPAITAGLFRQRGCVVTLLLSAALGIGVVFLWWEWSFTDCPPHVAIREIDERVDTDSLYRSWLRFSKETDTTKRRTIARVIDCETTRIRNIERVGEGAVRLTELRVAPPERFAQLAESAHVAYIAPSLISSYACDTPAGVVSGQLLDAETGQPIARDMAMVAISTTHYLRSTIADARFMFEVVPASADSATLFACADGYPIATRRILVSDGSIATINVEMRRTRDVDQSQLPGRGADPIDVCRKVAKQAP